MLLIKNKLSIYRFILINSFKQRIMYRAGIWMNIIEGVLLVFLQASLWKALISTGYTNVTLKEMISFIVINSVVGYAAYSNVSGLISSRISDGSIAIDMILPINFKWKLFSKFSRME